jgi:hypothetical protein
MHIAIYVSLLFALLGLLVWILETPKPRSWAEIGKWTYVVCLLAFMMTVSGIVESCGGCNVTTDPPRHERP